MSKLFPIREIFLASVLSVALITPTIVHAAWIDGDPSEIRIDVDAAWAAGKEIRKVVKKNDANVTAQSDQILVGKSAEPAPMAWLTYQTNGQPFNYLGTMDALRTNGTFKGAEIASDGRTTLKVSTVFGDVEVLKFKAVVNSMNRECATWREGFRGSTILVTGFMCGSKDQPLPDADVIAALAALKKLKD
ncbi:hypothetical protein ACFSM5_11265 [Lacibacterium aquatile]|uniref:Uncharacterized protein n=1 Tax=Lacibacterium aquatile TaxID=1168082 RepID=A0ABW5DST9_9PROT